MRLGSAKPNEATRAQRRLASAADAELRRRHPGLSLGKPDCRGANTGSRCCAGTRGWRCASGEWADASAAAMRALGLGRAATLLDVPAEAVHGEFVARLERLRFQALEDRFDAGLRLG
jgi:hypothetical protein